MEKEMENDMEEAVLLKGIIGVIEAVVDSFWATPDCVQVTLEGSRSMHVRALSDSSSISAISGIRDPNIDHNI